MSGPVKVGLLIGVAIIISVVMWIYFSPFHTCVRAGMAGRTFNTTDYTEESVRRGVVTRCAEISR